MTGSIERPSGTTGPADPSRPARPSAVTADEARQAARSWWDAASPSYQAEHGAFLGEAELVWGPEGLTEADARLLGPVAGRRVLEVGAGGAQGARWLRTQGADAVALDLSAAQLAAAARLDARTGVPVPAVQCDAVALPFAAATFDLACSAYGALQFVADPGAVHREVARVLRPGGRWAFSVTHPVRWAFPDVPGDAGLTAVHSYFDRRPYVETDDAGRVTYVEQHRTLGDQVGLLVDAGFAVVGLVEPEWPDGHEQVWGGWSPRRGRLLPGTVVLVADRR